MKKIKHSYMKLSKIVVLTICILTSNPLFSISDFLKKASLPPDHPIFERFSDEYLILQVGEEKPINFYGEALVYWRSFGFHKVSIISKINSEENPEIRFLGTEVGKAKFVFRKINEAMEHTVFINVIS